MNARKLKYELAREVMYTVVTVGSNVMTETSHSNKLHRSGNHDQTV